MDQLWGVGEVSDYLGVPITTLYRWRSHRYGPPARRVGKHLRYRAVDVVDWLERLPDQVC
jgi:excisionase family DNA binding protein